MTCFVRSDHPIPRDMGRAICFLEQSHYGSVVNFLLI